MKIYLAGVLLFLQTGVFAQSVSISGRVLDEYSQSLPSAAVVVLRVVDSVKVKSLMTDSLGYFKVADIAKGKYLICVNYMGYTPYYGKAFELSEFQKQYHYGELHLMPDTRMLNTVVVSGTPPLISQRLDRTVMNVEKSVMAEGNTALELLSKAPGVSVNENGEVSLKGRSGTSVMINGKLSYLSGSQLATLLRGTSSSAVSKIEIIANPSAGYDASGSGGIVNIILKKNVNSGLSGSVSANGGWGRGARYGNSVNLGYQKDKLNLYGSYDLTVHDYTSYTDVERNFYDKSSQTVILQSTFQHSEEKASLRAHNFRAGADLNFNDRNVIGFLVNGATGKYPSGQQTNTQWVNVQHKQPLWNASTWTEGKERWTDLLYNMNYIHLQRDKSLKWIWTMLVIFRK